ncbi:hypothetical protein C7Y45_08995 [Brevibacillus brevis]|nr:hypothetical protein C7Y45_08995 [Lysinibacillus sp. SDF0063]
MPSLGTFSMTAFSLLCQTCLLPTLMGLTELLVVQPDTPIRWLASSLDWLNP